MKLAIAMQLFAGGQGSGCRGPNCGRPRTGSAVSRGHKPKNAKQTLNETRKGDPNSRVSKMTSNKWVSKDGTVVPVWKMKDRHLTSVLRQLHEQLSLVKKTAGVGSTILYDNRAHGSDGKIIERAIPPYRAMVKEAKKRGLRW